jgi:hypothetical protein
MKFLVMLFSPTPPPTPPKTSDSYVCGVTITALERGAKHSDTCKQGIYLIAAVFLVCHVVFPDNDGGNCHRNMFEYSLTLQICA